MKMKLLLYEKEREERKEDEEGKKKSLDRPTEKGKDEKDEKFFIFFSF